MKRILFAGVLAGVLAAGTAGATDIVWTNTAGGNWSNPTNWFPNQVPGASDAVLITNSGTYTVTVNVNATVASLRVGGNSGSQTLAIPSLTLTLNGASLLDTNCTFAISGGTLTGTGDVTVAGTLTWAGGTMSGSGKTILANGSMLNLSVNPHFLNRVLQNDGAATWTAGPLVMNGGTFANNGTFTANSGSALDSYGSGGTNAFDNAGTFTKQGAGATRFYVSVTGVSFNNSGAVDVQGGTLELNAGGTHSDDFAVAGAATLRLNGVHSFSAGADLTGAGSLSVAGGTTTAAGTVNLGGATFSAGTATFNGSFTAASSLTVNGGTANFNGTTAFPPGAVLSLSGGTLGGSGEVTMAGALTWSGGDMSGSGKTILASGSTLSLSFNPHGLNRALQNDGAATWTAGPLVMNGGTFANNGTFTANSGSALDSYGSGGTNAFNNAGTFTKQGAGVTRFFASSTAVRFSNSGAVDVQGGTLVLDAGGTHSNDFAVAGGATLRLNGVHSFSDAVDFTGAGSLNVAGGTTTAAGTVNLGGAMFSGGTATFSGAFTGASSLTVSGGTVNFNGPTAFPPGAALTVSSGTLGGSADVTVAGALTWSGGDMSGSGKTILASGSTLSLSSNLHGLNRVLQNDGAATWTAGLLVMNGGTFANNGTFTAASGSALSCYGAGGVNAFDNAGTFTKQGAGVASFFTSSFDVRFSNNGAVDIQGGTLGLDAGGTHSNDFAVAGGATLRLSGAHSFSAAADFTGAGSLSVAGGTTTAAGTVNLGGATFSAGTATFSGSFTGASSLTVNGGTVNFNGPTAFPPGAALTVSSGTLGGLGDVAVAGVLTWSGGTMSGSGKTILANGSTLNLIANQHDLNRVLQNDGAATWTAGVLQMNGGTFANNGTFTANSGSALDSYGSGGSNAFNNAGTFTKQGAGVTRFATTYTGVRFNNSGAVDVQGGTLGLDADGTHSNDFAVAGTATLRLNGVHSFSAAADFTGAGNVSVVGGTTTAAGTVNLGGAMFSGGAATFNGSFTVASSLTVSSGTVNFNGTTAFPPGAVLTLSGGTLGGSGEVTMAGALTWSGGAMSGSGKTILANGSTLNLSANQHDLNRVLQNDGAATWTAGAFVMNGGTFANIGTFTANSGSALSCYGAGGVNAFDNAGTFTKQGAGQTRFYTSGVGVSFNNSGAVDIQGGTLRCDTAFTQASGWTTLIGGNFGSAALIRLLGGTLGGEGIVTGNVTNNGTVSPGLSAGQLIVIGNYLQSSNGALNIELGGTAPGTGFDRLVVSNTAALAGALNVSLTDFYPAPSNTFQFLVCGTRTNTFTATNYPVDQIGVEVAYSPTGAVLKIVNTLPVIPFIGTLTNDEISLLSFTVGATDGDLPAQTLAYALTNSPGNASIDAASGLLTWTPTEDQGPGTYGFTVVVSDNGLNNLTSTQTFQVVVNEVNVAPVLTAPTNTVLNEGVLLSVSASATDADRPTNTLTFALVAPPTNMTINAGSGAILWTPAEAQGPATNVIVVTVTDTNPAAVNAKSFTVTNTFTVTINEVNVAPVLTAPSNTVLNEGALLSVSASATDADLPANALTFALVAPPTNMTINAGSGAILWTPAEAQGTATNVIVVTVTDTNPAAVNAKSFTVTNTFTVTVNEVNVAPVLTAPTNTVLNEGALLSVSASATDADLPANALTFALVAPPTNMTINAGSGAILWTPAEAQGPATNVIVVTVTDTNPAAVNAKSFTVTNTFTVTVNEVNVAPVLTAPTNTVLNEGALLSVSASATDADLPANALTFALVAPPTNMTIDAGSGAILWTPAEAQGPATNVIVVTVTDTNPAAVNAKSFTVTNTFTVTINEVNVAPVLVAISDHTVDPGFVLTITNAATDADLPTNTLTFSLSAFPAGASIDPVSGIFHWRPAIAQASSSNAIQVKITDDGAPSLSATQTFLVVVNPVTPTDIAGLSLSNGQIRFVINGGTGPDYTVQAATNLLTPVTWSSLLTFSNVAAMPLNFTDTVTSNAPVRFYRALLGP